MSQQAFIDPSEEKVFSEHVRIPFGRGELEGVLVYDAEKSKGDGLILLSPHPNFAGTMDNNVIKELASLLSASGFFVLRFNYPGMGSSSLSLPMGVTVLDYWDQVEKEQRFDEAIRPSLAALTFLNQSLGQCLNKIHLVGYSFGAMIALMIAEKLNLISSVTAISLPWIARYHYDFLRQGGCRKLFIAGKQDFAFEPAAYEKAWPYVAEPKTSIWLDCDHFFRKREKDLGKEILGFLLERI